MEDFIEKLCDKVVLENTIKCLISLMKNLSLSLNDVMNDMGVSDELRPAVNE